MPALEYSRLIEFVVYVVEFTGQFMLVLAHLIVIVPFGQMSGFEHLKHQYRMMSSERTSRFGDNVRLLQPVFLAHINERRYRVVDILLNGIVHAALACAASCAVVVNAKATAYINKINVEANLAQLHIELTCFAQGILYAAYLGNLAANVEMDKLEAVLHLGLLHIVESLEQFARIEAKLALVATRFFPFSAAGTRQLDSDSHIRAYVEAFRNVGNKFQLVEFLCHDVYAAAHLLCQQRQLYIVLILVAVAHNHRALVDVKRKHCMKLRL